MRSREFRAVTVCVTVAIASMFSAVPGGKILVIGAEFDQWVSQFCVQAKATAVSSFVDDLVSGLR